jgi:hypothetical protein
LRFTHRVRDAFVNAIEIVPGIPGRLRPIRIAMRANPTRTRTAIYGWPTLLARRSIGFASAARRRTDDPELYRGERFGNLTYVIPVAQGSSYAVTMKFAEA